MALLPLAAPAAEKSASLWLTKSDKSELFALQPARLPMTAGTNAAGSTIHVDDKQECQGIDGFGFALTGGSAMHLIHMEAPVRAVVLKELFGTGTNDIGISYLRVSIGASDLNERVFTYDDLPSREDSDPTMARFDLGPDRQDVIPVLKEIVAINPKIKILGSPWTAPSWMKNNFAVKGGNLKPECYPAYALYFVKYIQAMKAEGIRIDAITVQNEPLHPGNTPSLQMFATNQLEFIKLHVGPAFAAAKIDTKIILYDHNCDAPEYPLTILRDPEAAKYADGSGFHLYRGTIDAMTKVHDEFPQKNLYFTEQMVTESPTRPTIGITGPVSRLIIGATRNWSRNVILWNLAADENNRPHTDNGGCTSCQGAITIKGNFITRNLAYYAVAHASKLVRPGSVRVASNLLPGLSNVAFKTPDGMALIVANTSREAQTFNVQCHDQSFTATLDAGSVGTFTW